MIKKLLLQFLNQPPLLLVSFLALFLHPNICAAENHPSTNAEITSKEPSCQDFLANLNKKPKNLEFIECKKIVQHGDPALESNYRVKGANAIAVEAYFVKTAHMPELRNICCGWESLPKNPKSKQPYGVYELGQNTYLISMDSGETLVSQRSRWGNIPYFNVTVILYFDTP